jgi:hypothetical protein
VPFTLAHPAIVLPFRSRWPGAFLALFIGSMAPDMPYFLPVSLGILIPNGHSLYGSLVTSLPFGLLFYALLVSGRRVIVAPLWGVHRHLLDGALGRAWRDRSRWPLTVVAVYAGVWTHLFWDSFTHHYGWSVRHIRVLTDTVSIIPGMPIEVCRLLQYASSVLGCLLILAWYRHRVLLERQGLTAPLAEARWRPSALAAVCLLAGVWGLADLRRIGPRAAEVHLAGYVLSTGAVGAFVLLYALLGLGIVAADTSSSRRS